ncbi:MAG TPA: hypothetical protein VEA18_03535 [Candidatus Kapabacteria bacterium]|nr:hypothetical protein [Candidatus Kapabacteria bacterium]
MPVKQQKKKAYIVTVDMGYGHQRAAYPLRDIAFGGIITANTYGGIPAHDRHLWESGQLLYEKISRLKHIPGLGTLVFDIMDYIQRIEPFYPKRNLSKPLLQTKQIYRLIRKGWGKDLIETLNKKPLPFVSTFFTPAFFAEEHGYKGEIYTICTDTDVSRAWAPLRPQKTRITYLVPNRRVKERLERYGIPEDRIVITGFPLPKENIGNNGRILKESLGCRIGNLDPDGIFQKKFEHTLSHYLGTRFCKMAAHRPLTITFAVGGAGAQRELGRTILMSLRKDLEEGRVRINLVAGSRNDVFAFFKETVRDLKLDKKKKGSVTIVYADTKQEYFAKFNEILLTTDILWTKPSELAFYAGLGIPIIMAPTVGSQEEYNKAWVQSIGAGCMQEDPIYTNEWLFDWLKSGWFAQAALNGFVNASHQGTYSIEDVVLRGKRNQINDIHLL